MELAVEAFSKCIEVNPENKLAKNNLVKVKKLVKEIRENEKKKYSKMFL